MSSSGKQGVITSGVNHVTSQFSTKVWALIPLATVLGTAGGVFTQTLRLPLFLDALGTVLVAFVAGPWPALVTGLMTNVLEGVIISPTYFFYSPVNMVMGLVAGYLALYGLAKTYPRLLVTGLLVQASAIVVGAPITVLVFGGVTGAGTDAVIAFFLSTGQGILESVLATDVIFGTIDKVLTVFVSYYVAQSIPGRYRPDMADSLLGESRVATLIGEGPN